ncbi:hypothetical protein MTO96_036131 [Rhipicephalus appendiculatus]
MSPSLSAMLKVMLKSFDECFLHRKLEGDVDGVTANICRLQAAYSWTPADVIVTLRTPVLADKLFPDDGPWLGVHEFRCELSAAGAWIKNGGATLSPSTVEELSLSEPRLRFVHDILSRDGGAAFRREATELEPTLVTEENGRDNYSDTRTAALALLENGGSLRCVYQRAAVLTCLKLESADKLQDINRAHSGRTNEHRDTF